MSFKDVAEITTIPGSAQLLANPSSQGTSSFSESPSRSRDDYSTRFQSPPRIPLKSAIAFAVFDDAIGLAIVVVTQFFNCFQNASAGSSASHSTGVSTKQVS